LDCGPEPFTYHASVKDFSSTAWRKNEKIKQQNHRSESDLFKNLVIIMSFALSTAIVDLNYLSVASSGSGQYLAASGGQSGMTMTSSNVYLSPDYGASWNVSTDLPVGLYGAITSSTSGETLAVCSSNVGVYT
jgi:hypothetical protein